MHPTPFPKPRGLSQARVGRPAAHSSTSWLRRPNTPVMPTSSARPSTEQSPWANRTFLHFGRNDQPAVVSPNGLALEPAQKMIEHMVDRVSLYAGWGGTRWRDVKISPAKALFDCTSKRKAGV